MNWLALWPFASIITLAVIAGPSLVGLALEDARQRNASSNQPAPLTNGDCAIRGGVKAGVTHNGANSPERG